jgi:hypothetical protein
MTAKDPKRSMESAADKKKHVNIKKIVMSLGRKKYKKEGKSNTKHD